jgi:MoaD family protein
LTTVILKAYGVFKELLGKKQLTIKLKKDATVKDVFQKLATSLPKENKHSIDDFENNSLWQNVLILVNGKEISVLCGSETMVSNGDKIVLLPVSHGG